MTTNPAPAARRPVVVETTPVGADILAALAFADVIEIRPHQSRRELLAAVAGADAILNPGDLKIDAELLDGSPNLKIIANVARGFDNLPLDELARRGIWATNVPDAFTASTAEVTIGTDVKSVHENESIYIPIGTVHRLANRGKIPLELIEVQTGSYLGEDDIVRFEDRYGREKT